MLRSFFLSLLLVATMVSAQVFASVNAPFRDLVNIDGTLVTSEADIGNGKWQLVMIWSTDCHICAAMKPTLSAFHDKHKESDAQVYGIALDGRQNIELVERYMIDHKVSFPTYIGELGLIAVNFEINTETRFAGTPTYLLFNPTGELVGMDVGMLSIDELEAFIARS